MMGKICIFPSPFPLITIFLLFSTMPGILVIGKDLKVFKRGKIEMMDETQWERPNDYSEDFEAEIKKPAEFGDIYDEQLAQLPGFELHKNGKNIGWTKLPIVTRKKAWWSTPAPRWQADTTPFGWTYTTQRVELPTSRRRPSTTTPAPMEEEPKTWTEIIMKKPAEKQKFVQKPKQVGVRTTTIAATTTSTIAPTTKETAAPPIFRTFWPQMAKVPTTKDTFALLETTTSPTPAPSPSPIKTVEQGNALERLRQKLLVLRPNGRPRSQHAEVEVKSNSFAIVPQSGLGQNQQQPVRPPLGSFRTKSTTKPAPVPKEEMPGGPVPTGGVAWSRSWHIGPDGRMEIRTWDSSHGEQVQNLQLSSGEKRKWLGVPPSPSPPSPSAPSSSRPLKPAFIQSNSHRHIGPTFECRVLDAAIDGEPSARNDPMCPLDFPGIPSDGSCKCTYEARARDDQGCATGFIYTCAKKSNLDLAAADQMADSSFAAAAVRQLQ